MNKKVKLYLLIIVNVLAWGYVAYRVYGALKGEDEFVLENTNYKIKPLNNSDTKSEPTLNLNYADPFLKDSKPEKFTNNNSKTNQISKNTNTLNVIVKQTKTITATPTIDIKYLGLVQNSEKNTKTALLNINGKTVFARVNDIIEGVTIKEIKNDEIIAQIGKQKVIIKK